MSTARALFVGGTSSNAGKSWMTTAICAWLRGQRCVGGAVQGAEHVEQLVSVPSAAGKSAARRWRRRKPAASSPSRR